MTTEYKQAFVIVLKTGTIALVTVMATDSNQGEDFAMDELLDLYDDTAWTLCSFPVSKDLPNLGVEILKEACYSD